MTLHEIISLSVPTLEAGTSHQFGFEDGESQPNQRLAHVAPVQHLDGDQTARPDLQTLPRISELLFRCRPETVMATPAPARRSDRRV